MWVGYIDETNACMGRVQQNMNIPTMLLHYIIHQVFTKVLWGTRQQDNINPRILTVMYNGHKIMRILYLKSFVTQID